MNLILIVLCGTLMGAFNVGFFMLGYLYRDKYQKKPDAVEITNDNKEAVKELIEWIGYGGKK